MSFGPKPWQQLHWDTRAALNFMLGGTGAGLLIAWAIVPAAVPHWPWILLGSLALIGTGLAAVWLEIGRKLRAVHVFFNPWTSWMTRESFVALLVFALGIAALGLQQRFLAQGTALAALGFVFCQGRILRASKGIPAWREPAVTTLIVTTALAEGAGLFLVIGIYAGVQAALTAYFGLAVIARALAWSRYLARIRRAVPAPALAALEPSGRAMVQLGTIAPLVLILAGMALPGSHPDLAAAVIALAGACALATGWRFKFALITRAAYNQGFALPHLPVRGAR